MELWDYLNVMTVFLLFPDIRNTVALSEPWPLEFCEQFTILSIFITATQLELIFFHFRAIFLLYELRESRPKHLHQRVQ